MIKNVHLPYLYSLSDNTLVYDVTGKNKITKKKKKMLFNSRLVKALYKSIWLDWMDDLFQAITNNKHIKKVIKQIK